EKEAVMRSFATGGLDVLVATTVVEVGVDVPNATMMVVLDADRFGVSQLHQLRGRVGRGSAPGLCLLVTEAPAGSDARERLSAVASTLDAFALARVDLEQRREGDVLGAAPSGRRRAGGWCAARRGSVRRGRRRAACWRMIPPRPAPPAWAPPWPRSWPRRAPRPSRRRDRRPSGRRGCAGQPGTRTPIDRAVPA